MHAFVASTEGYFQRQILAAGNELRSRQTRGLKQYLRENNWDNRILYLDKRRLGRVSNT